MVDGTATLRSVSPVLATADVVAWTAHYTALGFVTDVHGGGDYAFASRGDVQLHVWRLDDHDPATAGGSAYLYVDDADALHREWSRVPAGRHVAPVDTDYGLREGAHVDPDGNVLRYGSPLTD